MDQSYIIRIYKDGVDTESTSGIVENVEDHKRTKFNNANQLWSLLTGSAKASESSNIISFKTSLKNLHEA